MQSDQCTPFEQECEKMNCQHLLLAVLLVFLVKSSKGAKFRKCKKNQHYQPPADKFGQGTCKDCTCPLGKEFDLTADRAFNETLGYLECPPCSECGNGTYRSAVGQNMCYPCMLTCDIQNRTVATPCGGITAGKCGSCLKGYVRVFPEDDNSLCTKPDEESKSEQYPAGKINSNGNLDLAIQNSVIVNNQNHQNGQTYIVLVVGLLVVVGLAVAGFVFKRRGRNHSGTASAKTAISSEGLLASNGIIVGENGPAGLEQNTSPMDGHESTVAPGVLETVIMVEPTEAKEEEAEGLLQNYRDGEGADRESETVFIGRRGPEEGQETPFIYTRKEGPEMESETDHFDRNRNETMHPIEDPMDQHIPLSERIPNIRLTEDSKMLDVVAGNVSGSKVDTLFRLLDLKKAKHEPERDLWIEQKQEYCDYILNSLKNWIKVAGQEATSRNLCKALEDSGFTEVVLLLEDSIEQKKPRIQDRPEVTQNQVRAELNFQSVNSELIDGADVQDSSS